MGNIQSEEDVKRLMSSQDDISGTYDIIMTYVINQLIMKHTVSKITIRSQTKFIQGTMGIMMNFLTDLKAGKIGLFQLVTGSTAEGLNLPQVYRLDESGLIDTEISDSDSLMIDDLFVDNSLEQAIQNKGRFYLDTSHTYPGFARVKAVDTVPFDEDFLVKYVEEGKEVHYLSKYMIQQLRGPSSMSGPAITRESTMDMEMRSSTLNFPDLVAGETSVDMVYAISVTEWPPFMNDWKSRQVRPINLWKIIDNNFGCFLVGAAHRHSTDPEIEWRISCSWPELAFAHQLTATQRQVYMAFKYIVKEATKGQKGIMTYHLKTTLFWTVEKSPQGMWRDNNLAKCLYLLLDNFILFLAEKRLPNYFIPNSNLLEHLSTDHIITTLRTVMQLRQDPLNHLLRYQKGFRLQGHSIQWNNSLQALLLPHIANASKILSASKDHQVGSFGITLLRQTLYDSMIDVSAAKLSDGGFEDTFSMMMFYVGLPAVLRCVTGNVLSEEHVYSFLRSLCQACYLKGANPDICFSMLRYAQVHLEKMGSYNETMKERLVLLEMHWNLEIARQTTDYTLAESHWDQCALVLDALNLEKDDIVTMAEVTFFKFQLWSRRYSDNVDYSRMMETAKAIEALERIVYTIRKIELKIDYQFYRLWRLLHPKFDGVEPNLTLFLKSCESCYVPHEILALAFGILTIQTVTIPSASGFTLFLERQCNSCNCQKETGADEVCQHISDIQMAQKLVQMETVMLSVANELFRVIVMIFNARMMQLDFEVPGKRTTSKAFVNFLLATTLLYSRDWKGALSILAENSFSPPSLQEVISKYCNMCIFLIAYTEYNDLPERRQLVPVAFNATSYFRDKEIKSENRLVKLVEGYGPGPIYNPGVDMSTYGVDRVEQRKTYIRIKLPESESEIVFQGNQVTFNDHATSKVTTYPFHGCNQDDIEKIFLQHYGNSASDLADRPHQEMFQEVSDMLKDLNQKL